MTSPEAPVSRTLMAAVIGMGVLIVLGTTALIGVIVHRAMAPGTHEVSASVSRPALTEGHGITRTSSEGEAQFVLPGGGRILSQVVRPDGTISLHVSLSRGEEIVIWNPEANRIVARFVMAP